MIWMGALGFLFFMGGFTASWSLLHKSSVVIFQRTRQKGKSWFTSWLNENNIQQQWPDAVLLLSGSLKAGLNLDEAFRVMIDESPNPLRGKLKFLAQDHFEWLPVSNKIEKIFGHPSLALLRAVLLLSSQRGGQETASLDAIARLMRKKLEMKNKIQVMTAQGKMTAWVVGLSPFCVLLALKIFSPELVEPFFTTHLGHVFLGLILMLEGAGAVVVHRMVQLDE